MKIIFYIMIALVMGTSFISCSIDPIDEEFPIEGTVGTDGTDPEDEEDD